jgi:hypothetical protein
MFGRLTALQIAVRIRGIVLLTQFHFETLIPRPARRNATPRITAS